VPALGKEIKKAYLLANRSSLEFKQGSEAVTITVPAKALDQIATVIVLEHRN
jgi:hypothetical protein